MGKVVMLTKPNEGRSARPAAQRRSWQNLLVRGRTSLLAQKKNSKKSGTEALPVELGLGPPIKTGWSPFPRASIVPDILQLGGGEPPAFARDQLLPKFLAPFQEIRFLRLFGHERLIHLER